MNLQERIDLLIKLGSYLQQNSTEWKSVKENAERHNGWFTQSFIELAAATIATNYLQPERLQVFVSAYNIPAQQKPKNTGLVMAGNIPLVGFHDWMCIFLSGHNAVVKPSAKDTILITHIVEKLTGWNAAAGLQTRFSDMLKGCDAYIATGSNNAARSFDYYFSKYPHIIRRNRTAAAILTGQETTLELEHLSDDINQYYGLGCRNVTKLYVPKDYNFLPLLSAFKKYLYFTDHNKYKNNYDYQLAIMLLNNQYYMTNGAILLVENKAFFSAISTLNYEYYSGDPKEIMADLQNNQDIQCVISSESIPFGNAQQPLQADFADGVDTMQFLISL